MTSCCWKLLYRGANKGLHVLLSRTQAGLGRKVKQEHEEISRNHLQTFICLSVIEAMSLITVAGEILLPIHLADKIVWLLGGAAVDLDPCHQYLNGILND